MSIDIEEGTDELLHQAFDEVGQPPPMDKPRAPTAESPTLAGLAQNRRPQARTVCERCTNSVWFTSPTEVQCYCRVMYVVTWSSRNPQRITACDGMFLGRN